MKMVKLEDIRIDGGTQYRDYINQDVVKEYAEKMRDGDQFPAIKTIFDGATHWLVDGFHRYFASHDVGFTEINVDYKPGTRSEAQIMALGVNANHGLQRNNATKRKVVEAALVHPDLMGLSNVHISKLCAVSVSFVGSVKSPEVKEKQAKNVLNHFKRKLEEAMPEDERSLTMPTEQSLTTPSSDGSSPDAAELHANEMAMQADRELMNKLLDSDEPLKVAHAELTKLNFLNSQLQVRIASLMTEKNECISLCKKLQKQIDKVNKK
jgi:hypothetical protein